MTANSTSGNPAIISTNPTVEVAGTSASLATSFSNLAETGDYFRVRLYDTDKPFAIITARLGRETGEKFVPVLASALRGKGYLTISFIIMPLNFEGPEVDARSLDSFEKINECSDILLSVFLQSIANTNPTYGFSDLFDAADSIVRETADHLAEGFLSGKSIRDIMSSLDDFHRVLSKEVMVVKSPIIP